MISDAPLSSDRASQLFLGQVKEVALRTDQRLTSLLLAEWVVGIAVAIFVSPDAWGEEPHGNLVALATLAGAALAGVPILFCWKKPGEVITRHVVGCSQLLWSTLLIHLTRGEFQTAFHAFGSFALLAFYRDARVIGTASLAFLGSQLLATVLSPGSAGTSEWVDPRLAMAEHAFWLIYENAFLVLSIRASVRGMKALARNQAQLELANASVERVVEERTRELEASRDQYRNLVETTHAVPSELDPTTFEIQYVGPQVEKILGWTPEECHGDRYPRLIHPDDLRPMAQACQQTVDDGGNHHAEYRVRARDGRYHWIRTAMTLSEDHQGRRVIRTMNIDVTEMKHLELELRQAQKLESVGRLAAGVAHEINTPIQFVSDSTHFVKESLRDVLNLLERHRSFVASLAEENRITAEERSDLDQAAEDADLAYLSENIPEALTRALEGLGRVATIVRSMKEFAHPEVQDRTIIDLNHAIESTLTIARNEYKYVAEVETHFGVLPPVECIAGEINQVILNLVVNAAHAIADVVKDSGNKGKITVRTFVEGGFAIVEIGDTGTGIPEAIRASIFDPFFTTKEVGKGTGQGLAIARNVIVDKHGGTLDFETTVGEGTRFFVGIPLEAIPARAA